MKKISIDLFNAIENILVAHNNGTEITWESLEALENSFQPYGELNPNRKNYIAKDDVEIVFE